MQIDFLSADRLTERLRRMDDAALDEFGKAAAFMCSPEANFPNEQPRPEFLIQLEQARAEWRRRHPKKP